MELYKTTKEEFKETMVFLGKCVLGIGAATAVFIGLLYFLWGCYELGFRM